MNFEDLQKAWQSQDAGALVTINSGVLMKEVRRNQRQFGRPIFWRDAREVGVALFLPGSFSIGHSDQDWSWYPVSFGCLFVGAFFWWMALDSNSAARSKCTLLACVESSLTQVNHQILERC